MKSALSFGFTLLFGFSALAICQAGDTVLSQSPVVQTQSCMTAGNCFAVEFNPATGQVEGYFGFHASCEGTSQKDTENYVCQRADSSIYTNIDDGTWSFCTVN